MFAFRKRLGWRLFVLVAGFWLCGEASAEPEAEAEKSAHAVSFLSKLGVPPDRVETSNGFDASGSAWSAYSTVVLAPLGPLHEDGMRLKLFGSYGAYSYDRKRVYCAMSAEEKKQAAGANFTALCNDIANRPLSDDEKRDIAETIAPFGLHLEGDQIYHLQTHQATRYDIAVMPGYQLSLGATALKAYLGPAMETRSILPADPGKMLNGAFWGAKGALETWTALGEALWLTADTSYFTGTEAYAASTRLGYEPLSWLALGPEVSAFGDAEDESARAGGFLRFTFGKMETTLSGGVSADYEGGTSTYGSASLYVKF